MQLLHLVPQSVRRLPWSPQPAIPLPQQVSLQWEPQPPQLQSQVRRISSPQPRVPPPLQSLSPQRVNRQPEQPPPRVQPLLPLLRQPCLPQPGSSFPPMQLLQVVPQLVLRLPCSPMRAIPRPQWVPLQWELQHPWV